MNAVESFMASAGELRKSLDALQNFVTKHQYRLQIARDIHISADGLAPSFGIYIHSADSGFAVKEFCREVGGRWVKEANSRGGYDYVKRDGFPKIVIFDAEPATQPQEVEL